MNTLAGLQQLVGIEDFNMWLINYFIFEILFIIIDILFVLKIFDVKIKKWRFALFVLTNSILRMLGLIFISLPWYRLYSIVISVILLKIILNLKFEKCLLGEAINGLTTVVAELLFAKLFCELFPEIDKYASGIYNLRYSNLLNFSIVVFRICLFGWVGLKNIKLNIKENMIKKNKISIVLIALIGIIATYFNIVEMLFYIKDYQYVIFIVDIISLIIYFYISIKNTLRINIEEAQEEKIYTLETYNKTLQIMYDSIRGFRHDFSNVVQGLEGYAEAEDIEGVKKMCKSLLKDCRDVNNMGILDPKIINNPSLYAILTNKFYIANQENVNMSIDVMFDLQNLNADSYELARIIGILLDNAIEAAKKCEERNVYVRFIKDTRVNRKLIIIENNYEEDNVDMSKLFEKGYTTKQNEEGKHGLGLWNVQRILNKRKNLALFTRKEELFSQQLEIYD